MDWSSTSQSDFNIPDSHDFQHGPQDLFDLVTDLDLEQLNSTLPFPAGEAYCHADDVEMQDCALPVEDSIFYDDAFEDLSAMDLSLSFPDFPTEQCGDLPPVVKGERSLTHNNVGPQSFDQFLNPSGRQKDLEQTGNRAQQNTNLDEVASSEPCRMARKTTRRRFTDAQLRPLREWLAAHTNDPYPSKSEKESLGRDSGLTEAQIIAWFMRARKAIQNDIGPDQQDRNIESRVTVVPQTPLITFHHLNLRTWFQAIYRRFQNPVLVSLSSNHFQKLNHPNLVRRSSLDDIGNRESMGIHRLSWKKGSQSLDISCNLSKRYAETLNSGDDVHVESSRAATWSLRSSAEVCPNHKSHDLGAWRALRDLASERLKELKLSMESSLSNSRIKNWLDGLPNLHRANEYWSGWNKAGSCQGEEIPIMSGTSDMQSEQRSWQSEASPSEHCASNSTVATREIDFWELDLCNSCAISPLHPDFLRRLHKDTCDLNCTLGLTHCALTARETFAIYENGHLSREKMINHLKGLHSISHLDSRTYSRQPDAECYSPVRNVEQQKDSVRYPNQLPNLNLTGSSYKYDYPINESMEHERNTFRDEVRPRPTKVAKTANYGLSLGPVYQDPASDFISSTRSVIVPKPSSRANSNASSAGSRASCNSRGSRRGRRLIPSGGRGDSSTAICPSNSRTLYQCTFCSQSLTSKYAWRRHEESIHAPQLVWICGYMRGTGEAELVPSYCQFCSLDDDILKNYQLCDRHRVLQCLQQPAERRTFSQ